MTSVAANEPVMDTRTPSPLPKPSDDATTNGYQPDLSQEVALLSTKLINAINFQTTLDDQLQQTKHELEISQRQFEKLQAEKKYLDDMIQDRILIRKAESDPVIQSLKAELAAERKARESAEKTRKQTEAELENLTSALFEEANEMVAAARKDTEAAERKTSQLKSNLSNAEVLLASQQEQLQDLKLTMERMSERGDNDTARDSVPSTPINAPAGFDGLPMSPNANASDLPPEHPLYFSQLLTPVLRNDVAAYNDFHELLVAARRAGHIRSSSSGTPSASNSSTALGQAHMAGSSPNLPGSFAFAGSSPHSSGTFTPPPIPLKDSRFYKRSLVEDIEPTLRLDQAPGLSFLSRRSVVSSLLSGSLVVEPFMPGSKYYGPVYSCALCGEGRKAEQYIRRHRFRTSDDESAQRYPLCDYCLGRIRAAGDFITFLRMVRDGYWRADTDEEQKTAWEESVRLRERMFWARIGGGVVPNQRALTSAAKSDRQSLDESDVDAKKASGEPAAESAISPTTGRRVSLEQKLVEVFQRHRKSMSIGKSLPDFSPSGEMLSKSPTLESIQQEESAQIDEDAAAHTAAANMRRKSVSPPLQEERSATEPSTSSEAAPVQSEVVLPAPETITPAAREEVSRLATTSVEASATPVIEEPSAPDLSHRADTSLSQADEIEETEQPTKDHAELPVQEQAASPPHVAETPVQVAEPTAATAQSAKRESITEASSRGVTRRIPSTSSINISNLTRPALTESKRNSSETSTGKAAPEKKQASGMLARVRAMEAQTQNK